MLYFPIIKKIVIIYYYNHIFNNKDNNRYNREQIEIPKLTRENARNDLSIL